MLKLRAAKVGLVKSAVDGLCCSLSKFIVPKCLSSRDSKGPPRSPDTNSESCINRYAFDVKPTGQLKLRGRSHVDISVIDLVQHPSSDKAYIRVSEITETPTEKQYSLSYDDKNSILHLVTAENLKVPLDCAVQVPVQFKIDAKIVDNCSVKVSNLESPNVSISTEDGHCTVSNIKSNQVTLKTRSGNIRVNAVLQGNMKINSESGSVTADRLQGSLVSVASGCGDISVKSLYAETSEFRLNSGHVQLGSCHGNTNVDIDTGHLLVDSVDRNFVGTVRNGDIDVQLIKPEKTNFCSDKGDILLKVPRDLECSFELCGSKVIIDEELNSTKKTEKSGELMLVKGILNAADGVSSNRMPTTEGQSCDVVCKAVAHRGTIELKCQDWFAALRLPHLLKPEKN